MPSVTLRFGNWTIVVIMMTVKVEILMVFELYNSAMLRCVHTVLVVLLYYTIQTNTILKDDSNVGRPDCFLSKHVLIR